MVNDEQKAYELLVHYMRMVFEKAGLKWHPDNSVEMRELVRLLRS